MCKTEKGLRYDSGVIKFKDKIFSTTKELNDWLNSNIFHLEDDKKRKILLEN